jgi:hypothetical protein
MQEDVIVNPSWIEVEAAIRRLDRNNWQEAYLFPAEDATTWLGICGGDDKFIATGLKEGAAFPTFVGSPGSTGLCMATVGGQEGGYPASWIATLDQTLKVAQAFYSSGGFECGIQWQYV